MRNVAYATREGQVIPSEGASEDRRIQRTRKLIQEALIELTIKKGFAAVTVRDITEYAGVNRATFYRHYQDKFDLLDQYAQEVYQLLDTPTEAKFSPKNEIGDTETSTAGLIKMFEHLRTYAKFYRVMLGKNGDPAFAGKIQDYIKKRIRDALPDVLRKQLSVDLYLSYVSSGSVGAVLWWLEHDMPYSPAEMAAFSIRLSIADMSAILGSASPFRTEG
jgi:AcrR family transcriptional regulator